jgi:hypothetical protein
VTVIDPVRSTVVAWYDELPEALAQLVGRIHAAGAAFLGDAFVPRDPAQIHATMIGLERAAGPFDPAPLAAHLHTVLAQPLTIRFGGFSRDDRRMLSRGSPLYERTVSVRDGRAVLMGWPVVDGAPSPVLADVRNGCATLGVTHRYGTDPDVYLVVADVTAPTRGGTALEAALRAELAVTAVHAPLSATDLCLVTYDDPALPRASSTWRPLRRPSDR